MYKSNEFLNYSKNINDRIENLEFIILSFLMQHPNLYIENKTLFDEIGVLFKQKKIYNKIINFCQNKDRLLDNYFDDKENEIIMKFANFNLQYLNLKFTIKEYKKTLYLLNLEKNIFNFYKSINNSDFTDDNLSNFLKNINHDFQFIKQDDISIISSKNISEKIEEFFVDSDNNFFDTGYDELNKYIKFSLRYGNIAIIAAQPGVAKTMFCLNLIYNNHDFLIRNKQKILYFTPDMNAKYIYRRLWSIYTGESQYNIYNYSLNDIKDKVINFPIIVSESYLINELIALIDTYAHEAKVVFIDYIQLVRFINTENSRHEEISKIISNLKILARKYQIIFFLVSQMNRDSYKESQNISHLKDSSSLAQDADLILILSNLKNNSSESVNPQMAEYNLENNDSFKLINLYTAKNRHGKDSANIIFSIDKENFRITYHDTKKKS